jgi:hypothetical protein
MFIVQATAYIIITIMNFDRIMFTVQATKAYPLKKFQIQFQFSRSFL